MEYTEEGEDLVDVIQCKRALKHIITTVTDKDLLKQQNEEIQQHKQCWYEVAKKSF